MHHEPVSGVPPGLPSGTSLGPRRQRHSSSKRMRILVLTKRQYMGRDLLDDRYGRFRELPLALAAEGHQVDGLCLSYRWRHEGRYADTSPSARVAWRSLNAWRLLPVGPGSYWRELDRIASETRPDVVWACSDAPHALLGVRAARRLGAKLVIDLYDNFESYGLTRLAGMPAALGRAVRAADGVTCVSRPLAAFVRERYGYSGPVEVIENAVPGDTFRPLDREHARATLNLPQNAVLIGTAGSLSRSRGIEVLFEAFAQLSKERPDVHLVIAGSRDRGLDLPTGDRVHDLGILAPDQVPYVLSALNMSVISNRESDFGSYCFPQKFYESVACGVPVVAAATGAIREILKDRPEALFQPEDAASLVSALRRQMELPSPLPITAPTWQDLGGRLSGFLGQVCGHSAERAGQ